MEEKFCDLQSLMYDGIVQALKRANGETDLAMRKHFIDEAATRMEIYCKHDENVEKAYLEEKKIETNLEIEKIKKQIDWKMITIEGLKVGVPLIIGLAQIALFRESRDIAGKFEETGHYTTEIGRKTNLPNIFKWK